VVNSDDLWAIDFYTLWCHHCHVLSPEWDKFARNTKGFVKVAKVDC